MRGKIDTILFDLDGTLYAKGKPIKLAVNVIEDIIYLPSLLMEE